MAPDAMRSFEDVIHHPLEGGGQIGKSSPYAQPSVLQKLNPNLSLSFPLL